MKTTPRRLGLLAMLGLALLAVGILAWKGLGTHSLARMTHGGMHGHGADGTGHDEVNMPGLRGLDTSERETDEMATMFRQFDKMTRSVTNLPNGIRTVTHSEDEELMGVIASHAVGMITRVEEGRDPKVMIQSPTLDIFFQRGDAISTAIDFTEEGLIVTQTSDDPQMVKALQTHAAEVTAMAERGMAAVHEMMMQRDGH